MYHWQIVTYLAWMSSGTHLMTLSVLRIYLREYPKLRMWRICGMLILFVMLVIAIVPTGSNSWYGLVYSTHTNPRFPHGVSTSIPAACFRDRRFWLGWRWEGAFTYILLFSNYAIRAGTLFQFKQQRFKQFKPLAIISTALDKTVEELTRTANAARHKASRRQKFYYYMLLMIYCTVLAISDMYVHSASLTYHFPYLKAYCKDTSVVTKSASLNPDICASSSLY